MRISCWAPTGSQSPHTPPGRSGPRESAGTRWIISGIPSMPWTWTQPWACWLKSRSGPTGCRHSITLPITSLWCVTLVLTKTPTDCCNVLECRLALHCLDSPLVYFGENFWSWKLWRDEEILLTKHYFRHLFGVTLAIQHLLIWSLKGGKKGVSVLVTVFLPCWGLKPGRQMSFILSLTPVFKDLIL